MLSLEIKPQGCTAGRLLLFQLCRELRHKRLGFGGVSNSCHAFIGREGEGAGKGERMLSSVCAVSVERLCLFLWASENSYVVWFLHQPESSETLQSGIGSPAAPQASSPFSASLQGHTLLLRTLLHPPGCLHMGASTGRGPGFHGL